MFKQAIFPHLYGYLIVSLSYWVSVFQGILEGGGHMGLPDFAGGPPRRILGFGGCVSLSIIFFCQSIPQNLVFDRAQ